MPGLVGSDWNRMAHFITFDCTLAGSFASCSRKSCDRATLGLKLMPSLLVLLQCHPQPGGNDRLPGLALDGHQRVIQKFDGPARGSPGVNQVLLVGAQDSDLLTEPG